MREQAQAQARVGSGGSSALEKGGGERIPAVARNDVARGVLLIEDNPADAHLVRAALRESTEGRFSVEVAERLANAVDLLRAQAFDAVLLDLSLPDSYGLETLTRVSAASPDTPVVVLTGRDDAELETQLVRSGAQDYILKDELSGRSIGRTLVRAIERNRLLLERRRAQKALERSAASFRALVETMPEAVVVHRGDRLVYVNPAAVNYLGAHSREDLLDRALTDFVEAGDRHSIDELMQAVAHSEAAPKPRDLCLRRLDGGLLSAELLAIRVHFGDGPAILTVARDLTERRRAQAQANQADRATSLSILAAGMAHEINNPLSYVMGNLDYLGEEIPTLVKQMRQAPSSATGGAPQRLLERLAELVDTIEDAREGAGRLRGLVADLKILSRDCDHPDHAVDVEALLDSVIKMLRGEIMSRARLEKSYSRVPEIRVDPARLAQVFLNLLTNAVQALPVGSAQEQRIEVGTRVDGNGTVVIEVCDTGPGIAPEHQSRVFDPFFTTRQPGEGAGLGLSICQTIVAELGGAISVESDVGRGTRVQVTLPQGR